MLVHSLAVLCSLPVVLIDLAYARSLHALPEDLAAFPKYRVSYLNGLPVLKSASDTWLKDGLRGGESEFMEQPWSESDPHSGERKEIGDAQYVLGSAPSMDDYRLELMKLGHKLEFLCLLPPPVVPKPQSDEDVEAEKTVDPTHAWSLLDPLDGSCLYYRQIWFTYSYCHNKHIRQFREAPHAHPHPPSGFIPQEDTQYQSYTLGQAPTTPPGTELSLAERARAAHVEIVRGAGPTYLVLRWGDGTVCDKTGRRRDVEIQFHCGMAGPDTVLFVKETRTCSYVLVVHTPRLCGLPGFRAPPDANAQAEIRCRQVVDVLPPKGDLGLLAGEEPWPAALPKKKSPVLSPAQDTTEKKAGKADGGKQKDKDSYEKADDLRRTLEKLLGLNDGATIPNLRGGLVLQDQEDGTFVIELPEEVLDGEWLDDQYLDLGSAADGYGYVQGDEVVTADLTGRMYDILKAAGYDVEGIADMRKKKDDKDEEEEFLNVL